MALASVARVRRLRRLRRPRRQSDDRATCRARPATCHGASEAPEGTFHCDTRDDASEAVRPERRGVGYTMVRMYRVGSRVRSLSLGFGGKCRARRSGNFSRRKRRNRRLTARTNAGRSRSRSRSRGRGVFVSPVARTYQTMGSALVSSSPRGHDHDRASIPEETQALETSKPTWWVDLFILSIYTDTNHVQRSGTSDLRSSSAPPRISFHQSVIQTTLGTVRPSASVSLPR